MAVYLFLYECSRLCVMEERTGEFQSCLFTILNHPNSNSLIEDHTHLSLDLLHSQRWFTLVASSYTYLGLQKAELVVLHPNLEDVANINAFWGLSNADSSCTM